MNIRAASDIPTRPENPRPGGFVRSPMNYIGGKYKLLPQILHYFPKRRRVFVDLFCGGCNVGANVRAGHVVFNDNLTYLIDLYRMLRSSDTDTTLRHIERRIAAFGLSLTNESGYKSLRELYNTERCPLDLFVLTAYSFNHQIRFNNSHLFNNPFGKNRSCFNERMRANLIQFARQLQSISCEFTSLDFKQFDFGTIGSDDFVYCDPPYLISTGTYNDGRRGFSGWNESEERALLDILDNLDRRGIRFALSNVLTHKGKSNTILSDWIKSREYHIHHLTKNYANANYHTRNRSADATDEVLITNYMPS